MNISDKTMEYIASLAKIRLTEEEKEKAKGDLSNILNYISKMEELDTKDIQPISHNFELKNVFREDIVTNEEGRMNLLELAPMTKEGCFAVPKTIE